MRMPNMTAEMSLYRGGPSLGTAGGGPSYNGLPAQLECSALCLGAWGLACAFRCQSDLGCQARCVTDAIVACCVGKAPILA